MVALRIGLAQVNPTVGDLAGNAGIVRRRAAEAKAAGCHLVAFPEMMLTGYPPEDLVLRRAFVEASVEGIHSLARALAEEGLGDLVTVVGYCGRSATATPSLGRPAGAPQNAAAVLHDGRVVASYAKHHLPNYGVFDEYRYFVRGDGFPVVRLNGVDIGLLVCEDLWQDGGPVAVARSAGVGLLVCINGSPYERGKDDLRRELVSRRAVEAGAALAYVNMVGGQDELVFDGDSLVVGADGQQLARAPMWQEALLLAEIELPAATGTTLGPVLAGEVPMTITRIDLRSVPDPAGAPPPLLVEPRLDEDGQLWGALVVATRDYVRKNGFTSVVVGLSGGIDSALVATVAADALGPDAVHVVGMPSRHSSAHSVSDAHDLAQRQGLHWRLLPIAPLVDAWDAALTLHGLAAENLQARVRGTALMAVSNEEGRLVLTTGNKSELATGFSTLYGDSAGAFAPLKDVPKSLVWRLARWRNAVAEAAGLPAPIPQHSIDKPPSAELAPDQLDSDRLPDYALLDTVLDEYVESDHGRSELLAAGHDPAVVDRVIRLVDGAEFKRRQYPPGPKVTSRAFGRDRRLPITSRWREA